MAGILLSWGRPVEDQVAAVICLGIMNNVLVIVFSSQFFSPIEPTVAAMYMIPFFALDCAVESVSKLEGKAE